MANEKFVVSPMKPPAEPPAGYKGGPGVYDGLKGYPKRTASPNAAPEKVIDGQPPLTTDASANPAPKVHLDNSKGSY